jgi:hypothetical protein
VVVTVVAGRFESLVGFGLEHVLGLDSGLRVLARGLDGSAFEDAVLQRLPQVAIAGDTVENGLLARLKASLPKLGIVVLVNVDGGS